ncbi:MAG: ATP-binding protein [Rectinemataceae bacterium]
MTIKRRIRIALSLMVILPAVLMALVFGAASRWADRRPGFGPGEFSALFGERESRFLAEFNRLVLEEPAALADAARLADLNELLGKEAPGSWSIYRGGKRIYASPGHAGRRAGGRWIEGMPGGRAEDVFRWSFRFPDGGSGLFVYTIPLRGGPMGEVGHIAFPAIIFMLILCNGFLSWWVASGIVGPLARLRDSAIRVGEGDLDFELESAGDDELGEVAAAFETMRSKLSASLARQLAEETARKELVAHVSHDLRTPVAIIRGHAEGLRDGVASTPAMRDRYLTAILDRSRELEALIELLFAYARLDLENAKTRAEPLPLGPFLSRLRDSLAQSFPAAAIRLELGPETGVGAEGAGIVAAVDPELLRRAMTNLVENAVRHGGRASVAIEWRLRRVEDSIELGVSDDGEGVSEEDLPRLFEPFFRCDRARGHGGSGLGLAIVRKIMETQGGRARAARSSAGGLEVTLSFPKSEAHGQADSDRRG